MVDEIKNTEQFKEEIKEKPVETKQEDKPDKIYDELKQKLADYEQKEMERLKLEKEKEEKSLLEQKKFAELADKYKAEKDAIAKEKETYLEKLKGYEQKEEERRLAVYAKIKEAKIAENDELAMLEKQPIEILELFLKKTNTNEKKNSPDAGTSQPEPADKPATSEYLTGREKRLIQLMQGSRPS